MSEDRKVAIITGSSQGLGAAIAKKKKIIISDRGSIEDSKEVSILNSQNEEEFLGVIFRDNDASCTFSVSILDFDL